MDKMTKYRLKALSKQEISYSNKIKTEKSHTPNTMRALLNRLIIFLNLEEPTYPDNSYDSIVQYLIDKQTVTIQYYKWVIWIGLFGTLFSLFWVIILFIENGCKLETLFNIKQYPSFIFSLVTIAFSQIEIEYQKRELYKRLEKITQITNEKDPELITEEYKKWAWQEFQEKFKHK